MKIGEFEFRTVLEEYVVTIRLCLQPQFTSDVKFRSPSNGQ